MKNKILKLVLIIFLLLIIIISIQAIGENIIMKYIGGQLSAISSDKGMNILVQLATGTNPASVFTEEIKAKLPELPQEIRDLQSKITNIANIDPRAEALNLITKQNPELANAIQVFNKYKGYFDEINKLIPDKAIIEVTDSGETIVRSSKTKAELFRLEPNSLWEIDTQASLKSYNKETKEFEYILKRRATNWNDQNDAKRELQRCGKQISPDLAKQGACDRILIGGAELNLGSQGGTINLKVKPSEDGKSSTSIIKFSGGGTIKVGDKKTKTENILNNVSNGEIRINSQFYQNKRIDEITYASFTSTADSTYNFNYNNINYKFDVKKGGSLVFSPTNNEIKGYGYTTLTLGNNIIDTGGGNFIVNLENGVPVKIDYQANGIFIDNANKIEATSSQPFSICLKAHTCATNSLTIEYGEATNILKSTGLINYRVGFTRIEAQIGSKTTFIQTPNYHYWFQVTAGSAVLKKDEITTTVTYKECPKKTPTTSAVQLFKTPEISGTAQVTITKDSTSSVVTEFVNIVDPCGKYGYTIGPRGGIEVTNFQTNTKVLATLNPEEQNLDISTAYGSRFGSRELTLILLFDTLIKDLTEFQEGLLPEGEWYSPSVIFTSLERYNILDYADFKGSFRTRQEAHEAIQKEITVLGEVKNKMLAGYSFEQAADYAKLNQNFKKLLIEAVYPNGEINYLKLIGLSESVLNQQQDKGWFESNRYVRAYVLNQVFFYAKLARSTLFNNKEYLSYGSVYEYNKQQSLFSIALDLNKNEGGKILIEKAPYGNYGNIPGIINLFSHNYYDANQKFIDLSPEIFGPGIARCTCSQANLKKSPFCKSLRERFDICIKSNSKYKDIKNLYDMFENEATRLETIYNAEPLFKNKLDPLFGKIESKKKGLAAQEFFLNIVTLIDFIPIIEVAHAGDKVYRVAKQAIKVRGVGGVAREIYTGTAKFIDDVLKNPRKFLLYTRPAALTSRGQELLEAFRGEGEFRTALGKEFGCLSGCLPDDPNSAIARRITGEVEENMLGAGKFIDNIGAGRSIVSEFEISRRRFLATNLNWQKYSENRLRKIIPEINERGEKIMKKVVETKILSNEQSGATIVNLYRGNKLSDDMFSKYLRSGEESKLFKEVGENGWNKALENTHISELAFYHQQPGSSRGIARKAGIPSTPFISTTTSPHVATRFSLGSAVHPTPGRSYIFEFEIPNSRVAMNPFNQAREFEALVGKRIEPEWIKKVYLYDENQKIYTLIKERKGGIGGIIESVVNGQKFKINNAGNLIQL